MWGSKTSEALQKNVSWPLQARGGKGPNQRYCLEERMWKLSPGAFGGVGQAWEEECVPGRTHLH